MARKSSNKSPRKGTAVTPAAVESEKLDVEPMSLPERCDASSAASIASGLQARRGSALQVDAAQVTRLGAQCVQVLLSAVKTWKAADLAIAICNPTAEFLEGVELLGLSREDLMIEGAVT